MTSHEHEEEWFLIARLKWREAFDIALIAVFGLAALWNLPDLLDPHFHLHGRRGTWLNLLPPLARALLMWAFAGFLLVFAVLAIERLKKPGVAALTREGAVIYGIFGTVQVAWSDVIEIAVRYMSLRGRRLWMLVLKLREPTPLERLIGGRYHVAIHLNGTNLKPEDVRAVLRRLRPDLLTLLNEAPPIRPAK